MKRFIRYLYEYEQGRRTRNVGFVKVERDSYACVVHLHGKGLRLGGAGNLKLSLFFREPNGICLVGRWEETNVNPALNCRIAYTSEEFGGPGMFSKICGVYLESDRKRRYLAAWDDAPVCLERIRVWNPDEGTTPLEGEEKDRENAPEEEPAEDTTENTTEESRADQTEVASGEGSKDSETTVSEESAGNTSDSRLEEPQENTHKAGSEKSLEDMLDSLLDDWIETEDPENPPHVTAVRSEGVWKERGEAGQAQKEEESNPEREEAREEESNPEREEAREEEPKPERQKAQEEEPKQEQKETDGTDAWICCKIRRAQLTGLAKNEWRLANNQFLMHGYYNYHHLLLMKKGERLYLGVPGIYHRREEHAAQAFGFPAFIGIGELRIELSAEERQEEAFGYWIRPVHMRETAP